MKVKPCPSHRPWGAGNGTEYRDISEVKLSYFMTSWMNQKVEQVFIQLVIKYDQLDESEGGTGIQVLVR